MHPGRPRQATQALGPTLHTKIAKARVLMVGAGGIGCELLKNLVLTGFGEIHIIDLDTIDLSNLNRQFLFGHEHIKRSKALVAKETASRFNPKVNIEAHHANIKDAGFNVPWYQTFTLVFNALDNLEARRHVNKMCLAANVPLIESGTAGFNGQVQLIKKGTSECYDCNPKETPKTFPVCTIRSTPSQPIHCIVWAKSYLFAEIFGTSEDDSPELDTTEDSENAKEIEQLREEAQALKRIRDSMGSDDFARKVFDKVFHEDIERLRSMEEMWRTRKRPNPLDFDSLKQEAQAASDAVTSSDQAVWNPAENMAVFLSSLKRLSNRLDETRANGAGSNATAVLSFDKDDKDTLDFVAASANLRSIIFDIETKSEFEVQQMAGNIIPAIATTNAMVAGLCVLQAFKVLRRQLDKARSLYISRSVDRIITSEPLAPPKPDCPVCGVSQSVVRVDLSKATLQELVDELLKGQLGYKEEFSISTDTGLIYDPDFEENLPKLLGDLNIKNDSFLTIMDEDDDEPRVNLVLIVVASPSTDDDKSISLPEKLEIAKKVRPAPATTNGNGHGPVTNGFHASKRKRGAGEAELEGDISAKRGKVMDERPTEPQPAADDDVVLLEDHENGAIMIADD